MQEALREKKKAKNASTGARRKTQTHTNRDIHINVKFFFAYFSIRMYHFYFIQSFFKIACIKLFILYYNHWSKAMYLQLLHIELLIE